MLIAFTFSLKHQLRKTDPVPEISGKIAQELVSKIATAQFKPVMLILEMGRWVTRARGEGLIDPICQAAVDANLNKLSEIVGGCERIASTPIPYTYQVLLHRTVYLYCFLLPFGLVDSLGWLTPAITVFIAYTFVAFEAIADELEEPFGTEPNDLPLNTLSRMIEATLLEMLGEELPLQPMPGPDKFVLD
jgi:putative membrane protein